MEEIKYAWRAAGHPLLEGPLQLECEFLFLRPKAHYDANGLVKPRYFHERPGRGKNGGDIDNLVKIVLDALNQVAYEDDLQVADLWLRKRYCGAGEQPETRVRFTVLTTADVVDNGAQMTLGEAV